jgi:hypothetical protein
MSRRPDPARIAAAKRAGTRERLVRSGIRVADIDAWLDAAEDLGLDEGAHDWIVGQAGLGVKPPTPRSRLTADAG